NSRPISELAEEISNSPYFDKSNEFYAEAELGIRKGQDPKIIQYKNEEEEMSKVYQYINAVETNYKGESICVILPTHKFKDFKSFIEKHGNNFKKYSLTNRESNIIIGTYRQIKGLEFDTVIMPFLSKKTFLESLTIDNNELDMDKEEFDLTNIGTEILEKYVAQYYVGVTRARNKLIILYSGQITPLLDNSSFEKYKKGSEN
ncbi:3'-5' exonuclease, partial [Staphylococcus carnosus]